MPISCYKVPEFFTVFLPQYCSHHLKIPSSFKPHLERKIDGEARIKVSTTDQKWKVDLMIKDGEYFFVKGWDKFVTENGLNLGEFMVFQYHGNSNFTVDIFGTDGLKKFTPAMHNVIYLDDHSAHSTEEQQRHCKSTDGKKTILEANQLMLKLKNPSFKVLMTAASVALHTMHIPSKFLRRYMRGNKCQLVEFQISDKTWRVKVTSYRTSIASGSYHKLMDGFADFLRDNDVHKGDVCVFEALDFPATTFKVSIVRSA